VEEIVDDDVSGGSMCELETAVPDFETDPQSVLMPSSERSDKTGGAVVCKYSDCDGVSVTPFDTTAFVAFAPTCFLGDLTADFFRSSRPAALFSRIAFSSKDGTLSFMLSFRIPEAMLSIS
jgi:hypothetical protein